MDVVNGSVVEVKLSRGLVAVIDAEDAERVRQHKWTARQQSDRNYAYTYIDRQIVLLHRFILDAPNGTQIDHINRNGLDNRKANLRFATQSQNSANSKKHHASRGWQSIFKGVKREKRKCRKPWRVRIQCDGKRYSYSFATELEAARAYDELARKYFGEFAQTNFPDDSEVEPEGEGDGRQD